MSEMLTPTLVIDILHKKVGIPTTIPGIEEMSWDELGVDSIGLTEAIATLERQLGCDSLHEQLLQTKNIEELVSSVNSQLTQRTQ